MTNVINIIEQNTIEYINESIICSYSETIIPVYIELMDEEYNRSINIYSTLFHRDSVLRPERFQSLFIERLKEFNYIVEGEIMFPEVEDFDFSVELEPLQLMMEGLSPGDYVEVKEKERKAMNNFIRSNISFRLDGTVIYLYNTKRHLYKDLNNLLKEKNIERKIYPMDEVGPVDLFELVDIIMDGPEAERKQEEIIAKDIVN